MSINDDKYQDMNSEEWLRVTEQEPPLKKYETEVEVLLKKVIWTQIYYFKLKLWTQFLALTFGHFVKSKAENLSIYNIIDF